MEIKGSGKVLRHVHLATKWLMQRPMRSALHGYQEVLTNGLERYTVAGEPLE